MTRTTDGRGGLVAARFAARPNRFVVEALRADGTRVTAHEKIFVAKNKQEISGREVAKIVKKMEKMLHEPGKLREVLAEHVPFYRAG